MTWTPTVPTPPPTLAVPGWYAVLILSSTGIPSAESFGTIVIKRVERIVPAGIASAEAFGILTARYAQPVLPTGIASAQAFGTATLARGPVQVQPNGIASGQAFGTPAVGVGKVTVTPTGIASAEAFGTATATTGPVGITVPAGIASGEGFGAATVVRGPVNVFTAGIASGGAFGTPTVAVATVTNPKIATLTETFATKDTAKWYFDPAVTVTGGRVVLPLTASYNSAVDSGPSGRYDLIGSQAFVEFVTPPNVGNGSTEAFFAVQLDGSNHFAFFWSNGNLIFREKLAGTNNDTSIAFSATAHRFWRIREFSGTVYWDTSPDSVTWTNQRSKTTSFALTSVYPVLNAGFWGTEPSPGTATFDNVNVVPSFTPFTEENTARTNQSLPSAPAFVGLWVTLIGAGGGGGSGRSAGSGAFSAGGGGGGGALIPRVFVPRANLGPTYSVTIGSPGPGGASASGTANGNPGTGGGATTFSSSAVTGTAGGGNGGAGGTTAANAGGTGGSVSGATGVAGTSGGGSNPNGAGVAGTNGAATNSGGGGGGGGGGISSLSTRQAGGKGGDANGQAGGAGVSANTTGNPGALPVAGLAGSGGGGAGGSTGVGTALLGGDGRGYGAGGGGGSTGVTGSGKGGDGGPGYSLIEFVSSVPVLFESGGTAITGSGTPKTGTHTISGNCVVLAVSYWGNASPTVTAQIGSTPMTLLGSVPNYVTAAANGTLLLFGLLNPPQGAQTITVTCPGNQSMAAFTVSYNNVSGFGAAVTNSGTTTAMLVTVPSADGQMVVNAFAGYTSAFSNYVQTIRYTKNYANSVNLTFGMGDAPGAASVPFNCTQGSAQGWAGIGVPLLA